VEFTAFVAEFVAVLVVVDFPSAVLGYLFVEFDRPLYETNMVKK
jgi:hypothetical protein